MGQAANVQFLVVGSITPVAGLTVQARLVNVKTGLIVQTAQIVAGNAEDLVQRLPQLAQQLLMNDEQKRLFDVQADQSGMAVEALKPGELPLLPAPPAPALTEVPPPLIPAHLKPPEQPANLQPQMFQQLPLPPAAGADPLWPALAVERELAFRQRCAFIALELGDNLFRRGRFRAANDQFQFCLTMFPDDLGVRLRVERVAALLPPSALSPVIRPRLAILDFATFGSPQLVPPVLGPWTTQNIAPYFGPEFEPVDRAELLWWMGRLGLTGGDVLTDPVARLYLGRALRGAFSCWGLCSRRPALKSRPTWWMRNSAS